MGAVTSDGEPPAHRPVAEPHPGRCAARARVRAVLRQPGGGAANRDGVRQDPRRSRRTRCRRGPRQLPRRVGAVVAHGRRYHRATCICRVPRRRPWRRPDAHECADRPRRRPGSRSSCRCSGRVASPTPTRPARCSSTPPWPTAPVSPSATISSFGSSCRARTDRQRRHDWRDRVPRRRTPRR